MLEEKDHKHSAEILFIATKPIEHGWCTLTVFQQVHWKKWAHLQATKMALQPFQLAIALEVMNIAVAPACNTTHRR